MKKRKIRFKTPLKTYEYTLPGDADRVRIEALSKGTLNATRDYPEMKSRSILITEARIALATLQDAKPERLCNDFEELCRTYIPYYIGGFQSTMMRYERDQGQYQRNKAVIDQHGWIPALKQLERNSATHLASIKVEHAAHPEWNQLS